MVQSTQSRANGHEPGSTASFGYEDIPAWEKEGKVAAVFSSVAEDYDRMNDAMSLGIHRLWKKTLVDRVNPRDGEAFLDVAGGTGDIAFRLQDKLDRRAATADITVCDINADMLAEGRRRSDEQGRSGLVWLEGNAETLDLPDAAFDAYTIAFGIRNVTRLDKALGEAYRVLKRGGRFFCLEFTPSVLPAVKPAYDAYSFNVIPWLGSRIAGDRDSYQYLVQSIRRFPAKDAFAEKIRNAGFDHVKIQTLSAGIAAIHSGWKI